MEYEISLDKLKIREFIALVTKDNTLLDLDIKELLIDDVIRKVYKS